MTPKPVPARRAYSTFVLKSLDESTGEFEGIATTPATDRMDDVVEPLGAQFTLPIPLLWQHHSSEPIGLVTVATVTKAGIAVKGFVAKDLLPRIAEAWTLIKAGLVRGLSIGFSPIEWSEIKGTFGLRYTKWDWLELSSVTIPANAEANMTTIKSYDEQALRAASGAMQQRSVVRLSAGASAQAVISTTPKGPAMKTKEQLEALEARRAANIARMAEIMSKSGEEGRTLDAAESEEYDNLQVDVKGVDEHLVRLREHQKQVEGTATPVAGNDPDAATQSRAAAGTGGTGGATQLQRPIVFGKSQLPQGTAFTRFAIALMRSKGNLMQAHELSKQWKDSTPEVEMFLKAAVAAGTTTDTTWAGPLVYAQNMAAEFVEFLRPMTVIGRIQGFRRVPFNIRMPRQTAGASAGWVGQGAPKPVSKLDFDTITLGFTKTAVIVAMTEELVRFSTPSAEAIVRQDLADAIAQFCDQQFLNPDVAAIGTTSPASITNGVTPVAMSGTTIAAVDTDVRAVLNKFITGNVSLRAGVWIMHPRTALYLSTLRTANDVYVFPTINMNGGTFYGFPVVTSANMPIDTGADTWMVLMDASQVLLADDGGITLDASTEASLQMSDSPSAGAQSLVSLWQNNMVGLRAERFINYKRRHDAGVNLIENVSY